MTGYLDVCEKHIVRDARPCHSRELRRRMAIDEQEATREGLRPFSAAVLLPTNMDEIVLQKFEILKEKTFDKTRAS